MIENESREMYLETILILGKKLETVHPVDVANQLGYSRASVSRGLSLLREEGLIADDSLTRVELTEKGKRLAEKVYERHQVLSRFFESLGVSEKNAVSDACKIEHVISDETFLKIKQSMKS